MVIFFTKENIPSTLFIAPRTSLFLRLYNGIEHGGKDGVENSQNLIFCR
jgi:hypothetical protein